MAATAVSAWTETSGALKWVQQAPSDCASVPIKYQLQSHSVKNCQVKLKRWKCIKDIILCYHLFVIFIIIYFSLHVDIDTSLRFFLLWPQVHCGHQPCLLQSDSGEPQRPLCPLGQECVEHHFLSCLRPPCNHLGICATHEGLQPIGTQCLPNNGYLDDKCARVSLVFDSDTVPQVRVFHLVNAKILKVRYAQLFISDTLNFSIQNVLGLFNRALLLKESAQS